MVVDIVRIVPSWLLIGILLGLLVTVAIAVVFVVGNRLAPSPSTGGSGADRSRGTHRVDGGTSRRHGEIREYLLAIDEPHRERVPVRGVTVPFYLPERDVAITFDAHDYFRLEREGTFTVLCEAEMPAVGLGRRLPFDVPEVDRGSRRDRTGTAGDGPGGLGGLGGPSGSRWDTDRRTRFGPSVDPVSEAFDELGLPRSADESAVKRAYRSRVKEVHPDQGGDEEAFHRLQEAYATAREHCRRRSPAGS